MVDSYIVWFANAADMVRDMKRRPPTKIMELGFSDSGRCFYVGLACGNGANYR